MSAAAIPADLLYARVLKHAARRFADGAALATSSVRRSDGHLEPLPLELWLGPAKGADEAVLDRVHGAALDIGCGPGRHVSALRERGCRALGLDLSPAAVRITRARGAAAMLGSVFDHVPEAGAWDTALLLDGNVGIGGDPAALLRRVRELLAPGGIVIAELDASGLTARTRVRLESGGAVSEWFPWAHVAREDVGAVAEPAGLALAWTLDQDGRSFAGLRRP